MKSIIKASIEHPVAVWALVLGTVLFGAISLNNIPIQLTPDIDRPLLQVRVSWPGATPEDVDREIVSRIESSLASLSGVEEISSRSSTGQARTSLTYDVNQDMDQALVLLLSKLAEISGLPDDANAPTVRSSNSEDSPIARLALVNQEGANNNLEELGSFVETRILEPMERVAGISEVDYRGGGDRELVIRLSSEALARYRLGLGEVITALRNASILQSSGSIEAGKRSYAVRTEAIAFTPSDAESIVIRTRESRPGQLNNLLLKDIATISLDIEKRTSFRRLNGEPAITMAVIREPGTNVVRTLTELRQLVDDLNSNLLDSRGLVLRFGYDETTYISSAIDLVQQNIWVGGLLAISILVLFLRAFLPTLVVITAIPVSIIGTFVAISGLGLSINVISLAGLAFAIGMVVDASIVSSENIYRLRQNGVPALEAAYRGALQVWAPILGGALTTVVVFIPVLLLELPIGQLFRDIGIAISVAVLISVIVSVTLIPSMSSQLLKGSDEKFQTRRSLGPIDWFARGVSNAILRWSSFNASHAKIAISLTLTVLVGSMLFVKNYSPKLDYLPDGNANFVFARILVPPGYNKEETLKIAEKIEAAARPLWEGKTEADGPPAISRFFFVAFSSGAFAGAASVDPDRVKELRMVLQRPVFSEPGARAFVRQATLFGRSVGGSRSINIDITGPSLDNVTQIAQPLYRSLQDAFPASEGHQLRVLPGLESNVAQVKVTPDPQALARAGLTSRDIATAVDVFNDGTPLLEVPIDGELVDLVLSGTRSGELSLQDLRQLPVITPAGQEIALEQLAAVDLVGAPLQIRRLQGQQALTIQFRPIETMPLEEAIGQIEADLLPEFTSQATSLDSAIRLRGAASELEATWKAMQNNVLAAIAVIILLLVILLKSFVLPLIIALMIPIAAAGGVAGLVLLNLFYAQPLDMLTMLGFVILTGVVVNNAILMVEQTRLLIHEDKVAPQQAIVEATRNRIRPIFMSTLTSLFGLLPLVLFPGAGSELYRGIGVVVFGGLLTSTIATLMLVPGLLGLVTGQLSRPQLKIALES